MFVVIEAQKKRVTTAPAVFTTNIAQRYGSFLSVLMNNLHHFFANGVLVLASNTIAQISDGGCPCPEGMEKCGAGTISCPMPGK